MKSTKLSVPKLAILPRSSLTEEIVSTLEISLEMDVGFLENIVEDCNVESSEYGWMGLWETVSRSLMKIRKRVDDKTQPCRTPLSID